LTDQDNDERCYGRHFQIKYNIAEEKYFIRDLGKGFGAFMKVINCEPLKSDSLINIGDTYIVVSIGEFDVPNDINKDNNTIGSSNKENENDNENLNVNKCVTDNNFSLRLKIYSGQLKIEPR